MIDVENRHEVALAVMAGVEDIETRLKAVERALLIEDKRPSPRPMDVVKYIMGEVRREIVMEKAGQHSDE